MATAAIHNPVQMSFITANKSMTAYISEADPLKSLSGLSPCDEFHLQLFSRWVWPKAFSFIAYWKSYITNANLNIGRKRQKLIKSSMKALCYRWKAALVFKFCNTMRGSTAMCVSLGAQSVSLTGQHLFWTIPEWQAMNVHSSVEQKWMQLPLRMTIICLSAVVSKHRSSFCEVGTAEREVVMTF